MDSKDLGRRSFLVSGAAVAAAALLPSRLVGSAHAALPWFRSLQYIAALGDPHATSGATAQTWGLWRQDPGPRGVSLARYESLKAKGVAPAGWKFDSADWWLEEHGLIMEPPSFPIPAGTYLVTGAITGGNVCIAHRASCGKEWDSALEPRLRGHAVRRDPPGLPLRALHSARECQFVLTSERAGSFVSSSCGGRNAAGRELPQARLLGAHCRWHG